MPGCVIVALKEGKVIYQKAYGNFKYDEISPVKLNSVYDLASVTKICATTLSVMKLYEESKINIKKKLSEYLPELLATNKKNITVENVLLHQAGLVSYIPFYKETIDINGNLLPSIYSTTPNDSFNIFVSENVYMKNAWKDTIYKRILMSPVGPTGRYVYSDNDFIFLAKLVEKITNIPANEYVMQHFYEPMQLKTIGFDPLLRNSKLNIAPTESEKVFRKQTIRGSVHDPGAAMMGGIAGHAGLFGNAYDIAAIMQMLVNGGTFKGKQFLKKETVALFTMYHSDSSRRGYGFDKPEKDNDTRKDPYPAALCSQYTFGHTGFTGTCAWADPESKIVFILLSNRVYPEVNSIFLKMNIRGKVMDNLY
jgi:beta-N-acetylhexosaminidase